MGKQYASIIIGMNNLVLLIICPKMELEKSLLILNLKKSTGTKFNRLGSNNLLEKKDQDLNKKKKKDQDRKEKKMKKTALLAEEEDWI